MELARDHAGVSRGVAPRVGDGMFKENQDAGLFTKVARINEDRASLEQLPLAFEDEVECGVEEGVAWANECCKGLAGDADEVFLEGDAFVAVENGRASADLAIAGAGRRGNASDS